MKNFLPTLAALQIGDRVIVPKSTWDLVQHHAIFLGIEHGRYLFIENKDGYGVRLITAEAFFVGVTKISQVIRFVPKAGYQNYDLIRYAKSKIGKAYNLVNYNCEHFANEVQNHVIKSKQSDTGLGLALFGIAALLIGGIASVRSK